MVGNILPWVSTVLVAGLVVFGIRRRMVRAYPLLYTYLVCVVISDLVRFWSWTVARNYYLPVYWYSQFACVALGFGIIWEAYGLVFKNYRGTARMARSLVTFALAAVFISTLIEVLWWHSSTFASVANIERTMRIVQAILLAMSMVLIIYYEIPLGLNVAGILFGYGWFVCAGVLLLTAREKLGLVFYPVWAYGQTVAYLLTLFSWLYTLRTYHPVPIASDLAESLEYPFQARKTRHSMARLKSSLGRALQP